MTGVAQSGRAGTGRLLGLGARAAFCTPGLVLGVALTLAAAGFARAVVFPALALAADGDVRRLVGFGAWGLIILAALTRDEWLHTHAFCIFVRPVNPQRRATRKVVPHRRGTGVTSLTGTELFEVVASAHSRDVEEVFILANANSTVFCAFTLRRKTENADFGLVDADRANHANLRAELVHQEHVRIQAQVAGLIDNEVRLHFTDACLDFVAMLIDWPHFRVHRLGP